MKKTLKITAIAAVFNILRNASLTKMEETEKFAVVRAMRTLRPIASEFEAFVAEAREKLKPEYFEQLLEIERKGEDATPDEREMHDKLGTEYVASVDRCIRPEAEKEVEVEIEPLTFEALCRLFATNDFKIDMMLMIEDVIGE